MLTPRGVIPAVLTPFDARGALDIGALERILDRAIDGGVHGVFVAGTQGEFYALDRTEYREVLDVTVRHVQQRVPVLAGVSAQSTALALDNARIAATAGADAIVALPPYFPTPTAREVLWHFEALASEVELPLIVYNHPRQTHVSIQIELAAQLASLDRVVGFKDSSGDLALTLELRRTLPAHVAVLLGQDALIAYGLIGGADGAVATTANVVPALVVAIWDAVNEGRLSVAVELQHALAPLRDMFRIATGAVVLKAALAFLGVDGGRCRPPSEPLPAYAQDRLADVMRALQAAEATLVKPYSLELPRQ